MKLVAFTLKDAQTTRSGVTMPNINRAARCGALLNDGAHILDFTRAVAEQSGGAQPPAAPDLLEWYDMDGERHAQARSIFKEFAGDDRDAASARRQGILVARESVRLLAPVPRPGKLICIGLNYRDHAAESNMAIPERPVVFSKFTTSVIAAGESIVLPPGSEKVDYEAELAVVIGRRAKKVSRESWRDYVLGYTNLNDVSARDFQFADGQWQRGKSCDTFAPMGESIVTADEVADPHKLSIKLRLNGATMQDSNTDQLIFTIPELLEFLTATITLEPGDVIATGTPSGVGFARKPPVFLKDGDVAEVLIEGLGALSNQVVVPREE